MYWKGYTLPISNQYDCTPGKSTINQRNYYEQYNISLKCQVSTHIFHFSTIDIWKLAMSEEIWTLSLHACEWTGPQKDGSNLALFMSIAPAHSRTLNNPHSWLSIPLKPKHHWEQNECPSTRKWLWHTHTTEHRQIF